MKKIVLKIIICSLMGACIGSAFISCVGIGSSAGGLTGQVNKRGAQQIGMSFGAASYKNDTLAKSTKDGSKALSDFNMFWRYGIADNMDISIEGKGFYLGLFYRYQFLGYDFEEERFALSLGVGPTFGPGVSREKHQRGKKYKTYDELPTDIGFGVHLGLYLSYRLNERVIFYGSPMLRVIDIDLDSAEVFIPVLSVGIYVGGNKLNFFTEVSLGYTDFTYKPYGGLDGFLLQLSIGTHLGWGGKKK